MSRVTERTDMIFVDAFFKTTLISALAWAAVRDIRKKEVSATLLILCGVVALLDIIVMLFMNTATVWSLIACLIPGAVMLLISRATGQSLGYGDGLMALCIAPAFGLEKAALGLILAVFLCGFLSLFLLVCKKAKGKTRIPFLPFMAVGMGVMVLAQV